MFKQVIKYTLVAFIWKKYRNLILGTLVLFTYFWLVGKVHADFIAFLDQKESDQYLALSYVIKWAGFGIGLAGYLTYIFLWQRKSEPAQSPKTEKSPNPKKVATDTTNAASDRFESVREKATLRSKSDLIIDKYPKKKS